MCIGIPMQVISSEALSAMCDNQGIEERVDLSLIGPQEKGTWVLVFLGAAREVMEPSTALTTLDAISAMQAIMQGDNDIDHMFEDLINRAPILPPHLQDQLQEKSETASSEHNTHSQQLGVTTNAKPAN